MNVDLGAFKFTSIRGIWSNSMNELGAASLKEATTSLNKLGEQVIREKAEAVAKEIEIYYKSFKKAPSIEQLRNDPVMKEICIQKVGETGYTAVHSTSAITYWHAQPNMIGMDLHGLATKLPEFWKILEVGLTGKAVAGYYNWKEPNGSIRKKYMANVPVKGTNLVVAATTYIDEFSKPAQAITTTMTKLQQTYTAQYNRRFGLILIIIAVVLIVLLAVIYIYSSSVIRPIRHLSEVADKISMGDLKATVDVKGGGEIAVLAQSIERMQTSVRSAIERLQKRR
ncbi:MAG TPA: HAMP domain-containing protein [Syntrophorhabdaceae bacterium]|nr:HAMP domain-containing protein [Syntrophorhabdaceae bacterium]